MPGNATRRAREYWAIGRSGSTVRCSPRQLAGAAPAALVGFAQAGLDHTYSLEAVGTAAEFSRAITAGRFGLVIIEARFTWSDGIELIRVVREVRAECPVILFTSEVGEELWSECRRDSRPAEDL